MFYINTYKKIFVNSVNMPLKQKISMDYGTDPTMEIALLDKCGKPFEIPENAIFYIAGDDDYNQSTPPCFFSMNYNTSGHVITFNIDTYTEEFLTKVKNPDTSLVVEIGMKVDEKTTILLQDSILAQPRVYIEGQPAPSITEKFYTTAEVDEILKNYTTKSELDEAIKNVDVDLTGYATTEYVNEKISEIEVPEIDLSEYATETWVKENALDGYTGNISIKQTYNNEEVNLLSFNNNNDTFNLGHSGKIYTIQTVDSSTVFNNLAVNNASAYTQFKVCEQSGKGTVFNIGKSVGYINVVGSNFQPIYWDNNRNLCFGLTSNTDANYAYSNPGIKQHFCASEYNFRCGTQYTFAFTPNNNANYNINFNNATNANFTAAYTINYCKTFEINFYNYNQNAANTFTVKNCYSYDLQLSNGTLISTTRRFNTTSGIGSQICIGQKDSENPNIFTNDVHIGGNNFVARAKNNLTFYAYNNLTFQIQNDANITSNNTLTLKAKNTLNLDANDLKWRGTGLNYGGGLCLLNSDGNVPFYILQPYINKDDSGADVYFNFGYDSKIDWYNHLSSGLIFNVDEDFSYDYPDGQTKRMEDNCVTKEIWISPVSTVEVISVPEYVQVIGDMPTSLEPTKEIMYNGSSYNRQLTHVFVVRGINYNGKWIYTINYSYNFISNYDEIFD